MIFVYIILCHVKRHVIHQLLYILQLYYMYMYAIPTVIYMTMDYNLIHYINILYYYYYNNYNSYLFFIFIIVLLYVCVRVCVVLCCLSCVCVCMCALLCVLAYAHTCVSVCVYPGSPSQTVLW